MNPRIKARKRKLKSALNAGERCKSKSAVPSRDYSNERTPPREPEGRAGCPQPAGNGAKPPSLLRRGESVSVQIVASRDDFAERGHPGRSVSPTRESRELTDVSAVGNRCAQDGRAPFRLRLHRAADTTPYLCRTV